MPYVDFNTSIRSIADDFYNAYRRCIEGKNLHTDEDGRIIVETVNVPAIVNAAFACELYVKLLIKNKVTRGHNLSALFKRLEPKDKNTIKSSITERLERNLLEKGFNYYLKEISNYYEYWRYIHEKPDLGELGLNTGLQVVNCFVNGLKEYIDSL